MTSLILLGVPVACLAVFIIIMERRWKASEARKADIHRRSFAPRIVAHGHGAFAYEAGAARTPDAQPGAPRNIPYEAWSAAGVDPVAYSEQCARGVHGPTPPVLMPPV